MKFRTKPFEIDAVQCTGNNKLEMFGFCGWCFRAAPEDSDLEFPAAIYDRLHDTWVSVKPGQWIILGMKGEFYPCDPEVFENKYEPAD